MDSPRNLQDAGEVAVRHAAKAIVDSRRGFPRALECAPSHGVDHMRIVEICKEEGVDWADVRELLEVPGE